MRRAPPIRLHPEQRRQLRELSRGPPANPRIALRAAILLRAAAGAQNRAIAEELRTDAATVARWRGRFLSAGVSGIVRDAPRPGRPPRISEFQVHQVIMTTTQHPPDRGGRWSARRLAPAVGISKSSVQRIWKARGIAPYRTANPRPTGRGVEFLDQVTDLVGVYLNPPERALAFATDRRARGNPFGGGASSRRPPRRSRWVEFRVFLQRADRETPPPLEVHLLLDSRRGPAPPEIVRWLDQHPRFQLHVLPSDSRGLTLIDRLLDGFSRRRDRRGSTPSALRLKEALRAHLKSFRAGIDPFVWTAAAREIRGFDGRPVHLH
ncbi:MAG TPA: helix-turn-helix domain-containing protein [Thermoplasmata archaeon]|nr:helix-turn-helix domain-containing protein [Thermoplasmata archaeon]